MDNNNNNNLNDNNVKKKEDEEETITEPIFNLPISFIERKYSLDKHIITDLELEETETTKSLYDYVLLPKENDTFAKKTVPLWNKYYTNDKRFIKDTQSLLKNIKKNDKVENQTTDNKKEDKVNNPIENDDIKVASIWDEITKETSFSEKYHYIDWKFFEKFNNSAEFLQLFSLYNMTSPILSLMLPIFFLILPFFILKLQGIPISSGKYIEILKQVFQNHHIGQIFNIANAGWDKVGYIVISFVFYILQIYQNIISCIKFYKNMEKMHNELFIMRDYLKKTLNNIDLMRKSSEKLKSYNPFIKHMEDYEYVINHMYTQFSKITPNKISFRKITQIGHVMKCFYQLYKNKEYHNAFEYSFGLNGYMSNMRGINENIKLNKMAKCKLTKKQTSFKEAFFPTLVNSNPVKNNYDLNKHIILTGPNAAGKTTLLKTTIFNIIVSQQIGCGFYSSAKINPYDVIHCYINIPDTSARDSLFQSEARRCKTILTKIEEPHEIINNNNNNDNNNDNTIKGNINKVRHFCVFDELYSGTNPYEAIGSAYSFLKYLNKYENVTFMLTTHFLDLCKRLDGEDKILNCNMKINNNNNNNNNNQDFIYTYKLQNGISDIKGGIKVLKDLAYPNEIIENTKKIIDECKI